MKEQINDERNFWEWGRVFNFEGVILGARSEKGKSGLNGKKLMTHPEETRLFGLSSKLGVGDTYEKENNKKFGDLQKKTAT